MPGDVATPLPVTEFRSLHYVDGFALPEPATNIHLQALWAASGAYSVTEAVVVNGVVTALYKRYDRQGLRKAALTALADLRYDQLLLDAHSRQQVGWDRATYSDSGSGGDFGQLSHRSRQLILSGFGLQMAAESGRRSSTGALGVTGHTRERGERVYRTCLGRLLTDKYIRAPGMIEPYKIRTD